MGTRIGRNQIIKAVILIGDGILPFSCAESRFMIKLLC